MPLDQLERAKASTPNKPSTSHRGSMPRDHLERATKGFVAESDDVHEDDRFVVDPRDRFQVYPQESTEPEDRPSCITYAGNWRDQRLAPAQGHRIKMGVFHKIGKSRHSD